MSFKLDENKLIIEVNCDIKKQFIDLCKSCGVTPSAALRMFMERSVQQQKFALSINEK